MSPRELYAYASLIVALSLVLYVGITTPKSTTIPSTPAKSTSVQHEDVLTPVTQGNSKETSRVATIIDGDTFVLSDGRHVRMIGIDTTEPRPKHGGGPECFSSEATARASALLLGKDIVLERDISNTDKYGRLLRYVYSGEVFINKTLVQEGYAKARMYRPDITHHKELEDAESAAKQAGLGLWEACK